MTKAGLIINAGVIDQDYKGEIHAIMYNRNRLQSIEVEKRDWIAQVIILPYVIAELKESNNIWDTTWGAQGFGSTEANVAILKKTIEVNRLKNEADKLAFNFGQKLLSEQRRQLEELVE